MHQGMPATAEAGYAKSAVSRLETDRGRYLSDLRLGACEPRATQTVKKLSGDLARRPHNEQILQSFGSGSKFADVNIERLSAPRVAATRSAEVVVVTAACNSSQQAFVVKAGTKEDIDQEAKNLQWAARTLGQSRVPKLLLQDPQVNFGLAAITAEHVYFATGHQVSSLADFLIRSSASFALEDVRAAWASVPGNELTAGGLPLPLEGLPLEVEPPDLSQVQWVYSWRAEPPDASQVRWVARQAAEIIQSLSKQKTVPQARASLVRGLESRRGAPSTVASALFELVPLLERHLLQAKSSSTSPLNGSVRELTEQSYSLHFAAGQPLDATLAAAEQLRRKIAALHSAERQGSSALPEIVVPIVWSHGNLGARHLLLSKTAEAVEGNLQLKVSSWSRLAPAPLFADLSMLLTSMVFETVQLPMLADNVLAFYAAPAEAGAAPPSTLCAHHLHITERTSARLLARLERFGSPAAASSPNQEEAGNQQAEAGKHRGEALLALIVDTVTAPADERGPPPSDAAALLAALRSDTEAVAEAAAEAKKISEAICDWTLPRRLVRNTASRSSVPRLGPPPSRRQRGDTPLRSMQWGWQAVREFRDAAVDVLPVVEGDVDQLWPALWLIPSLRFSLELLDTTSCPWPQKVWLLHHIDRLVRKLSSWLDDLARTSPRVLEVRQAAQNP